MATGVVYRLAYAVTVAEAVSCWALLHEQGYVSWDEKVAAIKQATKLSPLWWRRGYRGESKFEKRVEFNQICREVRAGLKDPKP